MPHYTEAGLRGLRVLVLAGLAAAAAAGCGEERSNVARGTQRMADTIAAIHLRELAHPQGNQFLNRARADNIALELSKESQFNPQGRYLLAQERLAAGQTREAISEFDGLVRALKLSTEKIDPQAKIIFDFLAMSWLRLGEDENCLTNSTADACILPFTAQARHKDQEGARRAITLFQALLRDFPDDLGSRWLLNIAYVAVGEYPDSVPPRFLIRGLTPRANSSFPRFQNIAPSVGVAVDGLSGGLAVEDFNRDGLLDIFVTSWGLTDQARLLIADGKGAYVDRTSAAGLNGVTGGLNATHADYDNDGFEDIFIMRGAWLGDGGAYPNSLLRNRGDGTFEDVTFAAGLYGLHNTPTAEWADFNLDGYLDLFVGSESMVERGGASRPSELFLNNKDGTFREVSRSVGIELDAFVKGSTWGDVNNDGLPDLYVSVLNGANRLYVNRGGTSIGTWRFEERAVVAGVDQPMWSFPTWFWDFDQDGWDDILVLAYDLSNSGALHDAVAREFVTPRLATVKPPGVGASRLYRNERNGTFSDVTRTAGLDDKVIFAMGSNFGDLDNDGWLDFYVGTGNPDLRSVIPNRMFRSVNGRRFEEVTMEGGFGQIQKGHAIAFADLDRDGDADVYEVIGGAYQGDRFANVLFENPGWPDHAWIGLELEGRTANRSAIGARVRIAVIDAQGQPRTLFRTVGTGGSFGAGSLALVVGVGTARSIERVDITWPDAARSTSTHTGLALRRTYRIVQGGEASLLNRPPVPFSTKDGAAHLHP